MDVDGDVDGRNGTDLCLSFGQEYRGSRGQYEISLAIDSRLGPVESLIRVKGDRRVGAEVQLAQRDTFLFALEIHGEGTLVLEGRSLDNQHGIIDSPRVY